MFVKKALTKGRLLAFNGLYRVSKKAAGVANGLQYVRTASTTSGLWLPKTTEVLSIYFLY